jgi:hypothetical protein
MSNSKISALTSATTPLAGTEVLPVVQSSTTKQVSVANLTAGRTVAMSNATVGSGGTTSFSTGITLNGTNNAANGAFIQGQRNSSPAWFLGDTSAALGSGTGYITYVYGANPFIVYTNNGEALNITSTQDVKATLGNFVVGTSGKGIDFSATPGTGTSELLDDYEEGTWTPSLVSDAGSITNGTNYGFYTKIGRQVTLTINATATSVSTPSGDLYVFTLPFNLDSATGATSAISVHPFGLAATAITMICGSVISNYVVLRKYSAGAQSSMAANIQNGSAFIITVTYFTTS